jgi:hypothetical protein
MLLPPDRFSLGDVFFLTTLLVVYSAIAVAIGGPPLRSIVLAVPFLLVIAGRWVRLPAMLIVTAVGLVVLWLLLPDIQ